MARLPGSAPEVLMGRAEERVGEKRVDVARLASKPDFTVGAKYRYRDMTMGGGDYLTAMMGISLPFFHRKDRYQPAIQEAIFRRESARYGTEEILNQNRYKLSEVYQNATRAQRLFRLYKEGLLAQASQAYQSSLAAYEVGKSDFASLLMTLTQLYETQGEILMTQADFQESLSVIGGVLGAPGSVARPAPPDGSSPAFPTGVME